MITHTLIGPYGRQVTASKLKFWFVLIGEDGLQIRQEVTVDAATRIVAARSRPFYDTPQTYSANFERFKVPADLSAYASHTFPRFKGDRIADAAISLLTGEDLTDATRVRMIGELPNTPRYRGEQVGP
ncbi:MAG: hypothetical protein IKE42_15140 [Aquamicrobium sp.]|nr:hypothetical protein [Aquamicrobium sp.]